MACCRCWRPLESTKVWHDCESLIVVVELTLGTFKRFPCQACTYKSMPTHTHTHKQNVAPSAALLIDRSYFPRISPLLISLLFFPARRTFLKPSGGFVWGALGCLSFSPLVSETLQRCAAEASSGFLLDLKLIQILGVGIIYSPKPSQKTTQSLLLRVSLDPFLIELCVWYMNGRYCVYLIVCIWSGLFQSMFYLLYVNQLANHYLYTIIYI